MCRYSVVYITQPNIYNGVFLRKFLAVNCFRKKNSIVEARLRIEYDIPKIRDKLEKYYLKIKM